MSPRAATKRPKIAPRRPQDDLEEVFFSHRFLCSILVGLGSDFGSLWAPFWEPKSVIFGIDFWMIFACRSKSDPRAAKSGPRAPKSRPRAAQERPRAGQERPRAAQERPKSGQEQPKSGPRAAKIGQERPKSGPRAAKSGPRAAKSGQERPKSGQERPKAAQERPKAAQERPRAAQERQMSGKELQKSFLFGCLLKGLSKHIYFKKIKRKHTYQTIFDNEKRLQFQTYIF